MLSRMKFFAAADVAKFFVVPVTPNVARCVVACTASATRSLGATLGSATGGGAYRSHGDLTCEEYRGVLCAFHVLSLLSLTDVVSYRNEKISVFNSPKKNEFI